MNIEDVIERINDLGVIASEPKEYEYLELLRKTSETYLRKVVIDSRLIHARTGFTGRELGRLMETIRSDCRFSYENLKKIGFVQGRKMLEDFITPPF